MTVPYHHQLNDQAVPSSSAQRLYNKNALHIGCATNSHSRYQGTHFSCIIRIHSRYQGTHINCIIRIHSSYQGTHFSCDIRIHSSYQGTHFSCIIGIHSSYDGSFQLHIIIHAIGFAYYCCSIRIYLRCTIMIKI